MKEDLSEGALYTDFYELTMAQLYFDRGLHEQQVQFDLFFRSYPSYNEHEAGYCVNAGLEWFVRWLERARFGKNEIKALKGHLSGEGDRIFSDGFLKWLENGLSFRALDIKAIPEGRVVHPNVPLVSVRGPLAAAQLVESCLLNQINYQTLIATKASRVKSAARGQPVLEFGLRRAQYTGANAGARAALIGGADFSSNTGMSYTLGYPPKGTHAHSMVQIFMAMGMGELGAFRAYAESFPDNCVLLVDTIDTLSSGLPNAIKVFKELKARGHRPLGVRLDSGDLAHLAIRAAKKLNEEGLEEVKIVLSNQLDELVIWQINTQIRQEAPAAGLEAEKLIRRLIYGVGTRLITSEGAPSLDGVYKCVAVLKSGEWTPAIKLSESVGKTVNPGVKNAWRVYDGGGKAVADLLCPEEETPSAECELILRHPERADVKRVLAPEEVSGVEPLQVDVYSDGRCVYDFPDIDDIRRVRDKDIRALHEGVKRLIMPHTYHVSLSQRLWEIKEEMIKTARK